MALIHEPKTHRLQNRTCSCNNTDILKEKACSGMKTRERKQHKVHLIGTDELAKPVFTSL